MSVLNRASEAPVPLPLPRLVSNQAQALSLIASHGADIAVFLPALEHVDAASGHWRIGFNYGVTQALRQSASFCAELEWAGASVRLHLPPNALSAWIGARLPELSSAPMPSVLQAAALETLLMEAVNALAVVASAGPPSVRPEIGSNSLPHAWTLVIKARDSERVVLAVLEMDELGMMLLAGVLGQMPVGINSDVIAESMPLTLRAEIGTAGLLASDLRTLSSGDVILFDENLVGPQGELWLCLLTGQGVRVRAEQSSYLVTQGWTTLMTENTTPAADTPEVQTLDVEAEPLDVEAELLNIDAVPVRLTFDLGDRNMTLAEVRTLQPGVIFDLQRPLVDGPVMIRANGALIGSGTLVEIDGTIGVCVAKLGKSRT